MAITAEQFEEAVGYPPEHDDLERVNCDKAGEVGHTMCGWCEECGKPRFMCGHLLFKSIVKNNTTSIGNETLIRNKGGCITIGT